jgi:toxin CptA
MSKQNESPLILELKVSNRLKRMVAFAHLLGCISCIASSLILPIKFGLCIAICINYWLIIKQSTGQQYQIRYSDQTGWEVSGAHGFESVKILKSTIITIFVIILRIKSQFTDKLTILVVSDALTEDDYRQLIVKLKTKGIKNLETI